MNRFICSKLRLALLIAARPRKRLAMAETSPTFLTPKGCHDNFTEDNGRRMAETGGGRFIGCLHPFLSLIPVLFPYPRRSIGPVAARLTHQTGLANPTRHMLPRLPPIHRRIGPLPVLD